MIKKKLEKHTDQCRPNVFWSLFSSGWNICIFSLVGIMVACDFPVQFPFLIEPVLFCFYVVNTLTCFVAFSRTALWCGLLPKFSYAYSLVFKICVCSPQAHFEFWTHFPKGKQASFLWNIHFSFPQQQT